jgi:ankyrin repeat protein
MKDEHELHSGARRGNLSLIRNAINSGVNVNMMDKFGRTALHLSSVNGHTEAAQCLVDEYHASLLIPCGIADERLALHLAVASGHVDCARFLSFAMSARGMDVCVSDLKGDTPLHIAARVSAEMIAVLLEYGAFGSACVKNKDLRTPLQVARHFNEQAANFIICRTSSGAHFTQTMKYLQLMPANALQLIIGQYLQAFDIVNLDSAWCNRSTRSNLMQAYVGLNSKSIDRFPLQSIKSLKWIANRKFGIQSLNLPKFGNRGPLHWACGNDAPTSIIQLLLNTQRFNVNERDPTMQDSTPLHIACNRKNYGLFDMLLREYKAEVNVQDEEGRTPLHRTALNGLLEMSKRLVHEFNCKLNIVDAGGMTALHIAAWKGRVDLCSILLRANEWRKGDASEKLDVNIQDAQGWSALHIASEYRHDAIVRMLCQAGAKTSLQIAATGQTPLFMACSKGYTVQTSAMLDNAENLHTLNIPNVLGSTPLHAACENGHTDVISLLLKRNASIKLKNASGATALYVACENGNEEVVRLLLACDAHGEVVNARNLMGNTPLHACCCKGHTEVAELLLKKGRADPNVQDEMGWTPLFRAVMFGRYEIAKLLVQVGHAAIGLTDHLGWTAITLSRTRARNTLMTSFLTMEMQARDASSGDGKRSADRSEINESDDGPKRKRRAT